MARRAVDEAAMPDSAYGSRPYGARRFYVDDMMTRLASITKLAAALVQSKRRNSIATTQLLRQTFVASAQQIHKYITCSISHGFA